MEELQTAGYKVRIMWECEWDQLLPRVNRTPTSMSRILLRDDETTLLNAIKNEEIFGFAVCSVETPEALIQEFVNVRH